MFTLASPRAAQVAGAALSVALAWGMGPAGLAHAQDLPAGVSPADLQAALAAPISVPAGQTTTVDLPVPAQASYSGDGWQVSAAGTSASVTAPDSGQVTVPVTVAGATAQLTLVAEPGATVPEPADAPGPAPAAAPEAGGAEAATPVPGERPERQAASPVSEEGADVIYLESRIEGNRITANLGWGEAVDLYRCFGSIDESTVTLRYLDGQGNIIEGVSRDIDAGSRTLTLTYPEGQAPDNPFIMQLVNNDGSGLAAKAVLRDPNFASADAGPDGAPAADGSEDGVPGADSGWSASTILAAAAGGLVLIVVVIAVLVVVRRRSRRP